MDFAQGFSVPVFGVGEPNFPHNAWVCRTEPLGVVNVYSPVDVTIPGVITCRPVQVPEWIAVPLDLSKAAWRIYEWLRTNPF